MRAEVDDTEMTAAEFRFRLKAGNGQLVATSEVYETKTAARKGAESAQSAADGATIVDVAS